MAVLVLVGLLLSAIKLYVCLFSINAFLIVCFMNLRHASTYPLLWWWYDDDVAFL